MNIKKLKATADIQIGRRENDEKDDGTEDI